MRSLPRRRSLPLAALTALVLAITLASVASASIVTGQSIAGVKLGASEAQVTQALGPPNIASPPDSEGRVQWNYTKPPFLGAIGFTNGSISGMWTASKHQKTSKGVGPGSSLAQVRRAYPKAKCAAGPLGPKSLECTLKSKLGTRSVETAFVFFTRSMPAREVDLAFA